MRGNNTTDRGSLGLSGVERHLGRAPSAREQRAASDPASDSSAPEHRYALRYLHLALQRMESDGEATEAVLDAFRSLGREVSGVVASVQAHFSNHPDPSRPADELSLCRRARVSDVQQWMKDHLVPLARARARSFQIEIADPIGMLPANVVYGLLVEYLRQRLSDPTARTTDLRLNIRPCVFGVAISIEERGRGPHRPLPVTDESTRQLWGGAVHLLGGSISWRRLPGEAEREPGHVIQISYPISLSSQFGSPRDALRQMHVDQPAA